jgi:hypothetical protein
MRGGHLTLLANMYFLTLGRLTYCRHDLRLESVLVRKTPRKVAYTATTVTCNVRHLPDMIKHISTCEQEDSNQTNDCPDVPVLDNGKEIWPGNA